MDTTERKVLGLLEDDSRITPAQIALMLDKEEGEIRNIIRAAESAGTILGYKTLIDWDKTEREYVTAVIELKVTPQHEFGFDKVAEQIYSYSEVQSVYLCSGNYDIMLIIEGKTLREVAYFVAEKLAPLHYVTSTATSFVLRKYKDRGVVYGAARTDKRETLI